MPFRLTGLKTISTRVTGLGHTLSLSGVALGCVIGQVAILTRRPLTFQLPDSASYIALGSRLVDQPSLANLFDAYRTPGYPALLALVGWIEGSVGGDGVVYAQAALMVLTALELYLLTFGLTSSRVAAALVTFLFASNVRLLDWERLIMTEAVTIFLVTTMLLAFWMWMRDRKVGWAFVLVAASVCAVLTRPSLLYLPICLAALVLIGDRRRWLPVLLLGVAIYLPVMGYAIVNDRQHPHAGLSAVGSINLLGKVLEYRMQGEGDPTRFPVLWQGITNLPPGDADPYHILQANSDAMGVDYADAAAFSQNVIQHHPLEYVQKSAGDFLGQWLLVPYAYIPPGGLQWLAQALAVYSLIAYAAYPAVPPAAVALVFLWRGLDRQVALGLTALLVAVVGAVGTNALFTYVDFARLRTPVDGLAFAAVIAVSAQVLARAWSAGRAGRPDHVGE